MQFDLNPTKMLKFIRTKSANKNLYYDQKIASS